MALKVLHHPHGHSVKMGRKRPSTPFTGLHLKKYLRTDVVTLPPLPFGYGADATAALAQMYLNDTLGDCVIAAGLHAEGVITGNAGDEIVYNDEIAQTAYGWCGYVPGNAATDQGCEITTVLDNWVSTGWPGPGSPAAGYLAVDPTNKTEVQTAIYLFENLIFGMELPDAWTNPMPSASGFTWDVAGAPDPNQGHCVAGFDATAQGISFATWAMTGTLTYAAIAEYCAATNNGELYVVITQDLINAASQKAPTGLDWAQLVADYNAMGGSLTPPTPGPTPAPTPGPTPAPTPGPTPAPTPQPTPGPTPAPSAGVVLFPPNTTGLVVAAHGHHPQTIETLPAHVIGYYVSGS